VGSGRMMPGPVPETPPGSCEVCHGPLRSDNRTGLCRRTAACNTERRRRELLRAAAGTRCLCSDPAHPGIRCPRPSCGCTEDRPDPKAAAAARSASTGTEG